MAFLWKQFKLDRFWYGGGLAVLATGGVVWDLASRRAGVLTVLWFLLAVAGSGIWFRQRWARWLGVLVSLCLSFLIGTAIFRAGFTWTRLTLAAISIYWIWLFSANPMEEEEVDDDQEEDDELSLSLVLLLREPQYLEAETIASLASRAWGIDVTALSPDDEEDDSSLGRERAEEKYEDEEAYVLGESPLFIARHPDGMLMIHNVDAPYFEEPETVAEELPELRVRSAVAEHRGWFSVDAMAWGAEGPNAVAVAYRVIARLLAELADENCLAVFDPRTGSVFVYDPETEEKLRNEDPLGSFGIPFYAPVPQIREDDPRMREAVEEARTRWSEFVAAFEQRQDDENFSVKGPFSDGEYTEFMWVEVGSIENDIIYGKLGNEPVNVSNLRLGDSVRLAVKDLNDWVFVSEQGPKGGFTIRVLSDVMKNQDEVDPDDS